jgi:hypothetical protein
MLRVIQRADKGRRFYGWFADNHGGGFASMRDQLVETEVRDENRRYTSYL